MSNLESVKSKLIYFAEFQIFNSKEYGYSKFTTSSNPNFDIDIWLHKNSIMDYIRHMGYSVTAETNGSALDVYITKNINLINKK